MPNTSMWTPRMLAVLRIVTALLFLEHATMKFFQFPAAVPGLPHPLPAIMLAAGGIELVTATLMTVGFGTRIAAFIASGEMAAAYWLAHGSQSFWPALNRGEPAIMFCFIFLYLAFAGGGAWTLEDVLKPASSQGGAIPARA